MNNRTLQLVKACSSDKGEGDREVQEALIDVLSFEVAKAKIKDDIMQDLEVRKESLRQLGQELIDDFEKRIEVEKMRMQLESENTQAETMAQFKELDDEIQSIRDQLQADKEDLMNFEARTAAQRNSSLFFQQLHKGPPELEKKLRGGDGAAGGNGSLVDPQVVRKLSDQVKSPAIAEVNSPWRVTISAYLTATLVYVILADLSSDSPSVALDALYGVLATGLAWNAWQERIALPGDNKDTQ